MKRVSVIVPVYNGRDTLERAISSVLEQSYRDFELILVDDGSSDGSEAICDEAAERDSRVRVIHQANRGVAAARNVGLAAAECPYVSWLDSDDRFEPDMLEILMNRLSLPGVQAAVCNYENVDQSGAGKPRYGQSGERQADGLSLVKMVVSNEIAPILCFNVMEKRLYDGVSFQEGTLFEDVANVWKLYLKCERVIIVDRVLCTRMLRPDSISRIKLVANRVEALEIYLRRQDQLRELDPEMDKRFFHNYAKMLQLLRNHIYQDTYRHYLDCKGRIAAICKCFRAHTADAMSGPGADALTRLEYFLLTAGNLPGFYASSAVYLLRKRLLRRNSPILG